jgi:N-acetylglutamate synthase-like GNAT family acetyltransferase
MCLSFGNGLKGGGMFIIRFAEEADISFIIDLVKAGVLPRNFSFEEQNGIDMLSEQLLKVVNKYKQEIIGSDFLFVFDDQIKQKSIGMALLSGRNDSSGKASHFEVRFFAVIPEEQNKGYGNEMLSMIMEAAKGHNLEVSCLPQSDSMKKMLIKHGFLQINETIGGKKTFRLERKKNSLR